MGVFGIVVYVVFKVGLLGFMKILVKEIVSIGIMVNVLVFGYFDKGMIFEVVELLLDEIIKIILKRKFGDVGVILKLFDFFFLEEVDYIIG